MNEQICQILKDSKSIAVLGISDKPDRDSGRIAQFLVSKGYDIVGVHPLLSSLGSIPIYKSLNNIPTKVDILDVFVNIKHLEPLIAEILELKPKVVWLQLGVGYSDKLSLLEDAGITVISDSCIAVMYNYCQHNS